MKTAVSLFLGLVLLGMDSPIPAPAPSIELMVFAVTDGSGTPNSATPGTPLPFFQPGELVRITVAATNTGDSTPIRTALQIAPLDDHASPVYDSHLVGQDNTSDSPLDNGETDYYSFDWTIPADAEWGNYDLIGSIRSSDFTTVYDETAPGPSTTAFDSSAWHHAITIGEFGTTVIVHGYQFFGTLPAWPGIMASDIKTRAGRGRIWQYSPSTGQFVITSDATGPAENILVFNWANESNDNFEGLSEAAGEGLFTALVAGASGPSSQWRIDHLHLMGHSRGAVVVSEAAQRLLAAGLPVEQITYFDPHWDGVGSSYTDFDVNVNHPTLGTRGVAAWDSAGYVDNFWSTDDVHDDILGLDGAPIEGARNLDLSGRGTGVGHSDTWRWYYGTINLTATSIDGGNVESAWYGGAYLDRSEDGFNQSRIGGGMKTPMSGTRTPVAFGWEDDGVVNGDFERGPQSGSGTRPGWNIHGGGGPGLIQNHRLELQATNEYRTRNRIWVPPAFNQLRFTYDTQTIAGGSPDTLVTYAIGSDGGLSPVDKMVVDGTPLADSVTVSLESFADSVITVRFELVPGGASVGSLLYVDDVHLAPMPLGVALEAYVLLEGPYSGFSMMSTTLNPDLPTSQPYSSAPWSYSGSESVGAMPSDVVDWMLLELRSDTSAASTVARRAVLLTESGQLEDVDGSSAIDFPMVTPGEYYLVVGHRNHLSVMSSSKLDLTSGSGSWDFTVSPGNAFGPEAQKDLGDGYFGMYACDIDADGQITVTDFNAWLISTKVSETGYFVEDCDLDAQATVSDFNEWLVNTKLAASSKVP